MSAEAYTAEGVNPHGVIFDEFHAQPNSKLWDVFSTATGARWQPAIFIFTTAGESLQSVCYKLHEHALKVLDDPRLDEEFLVVIYAADPDTDDWKKETTWAKANPGLGKIIDLHWMRAAYKRALVNDAARVAFRRYHLNIWAEEIGRYLPMDAWHRCGEVVPDKELLGEACFSALDMSSTTDVSALVHLFPPTEKRPRWDLLCRFWVPRENMSVRAQRDRVPYPRWAEEGWLEPTEGDVIDYDLIRQRFNEDGGLYAIQEAIFDPWHTTQLQTQLEKDGFTVVKLPQSFKSLSAPTKEIMNLVLAMKLRHGRPGYACTCGRHCHPVLSWMASNLVVKTAESEAVYPSKKRSRERIDGMTALLSGLARALAHAEPAPAEIMTV